MSGMDAQGQTSAKGASTPRNNPQMGEMTTMDSNGSMTDVLRVQMELNEPKNNLALLEERKIPLITRFNQLLNRPLDELVILSDSIMAAKLPASLSEIHDSIRNNNPMLKML